ncbi:hypothetical protein B0H10DRAFT_1940771 [Mycena sp. CBHHK59/15]|nr:hypothetical protein B0H10DRAFT_1940771 [Mycena sp. CBHHK59/15]
MDAGVNPYGLKLILKKNLSRQPVSRLQDDVLKLVVFVRHPDAVHCKGTNFQAHRGRSHSKPHNSPILHNPYILRGSKPIIYLNFRPYSAITIPFGLHRGVWVKTEGPADIFPTVSDWCLEARECQDKWWPVEMVLWKPFHGVDKITLPRDNSLNSAVLYTLSIDIYRPTGILKAGSAEASGAQSGWCCAIGAGGAGPGFGGSRHSYSQNGALEAPATESEPAPQD